MSGIHEVEVDMTELHLRRALLADCEGLVELQRNSFTRLAAAHYTREQAQAFLDRACGGFEQLVRGARVWVLETRGRLVGCAAWHPAGLLGLVEPRPAEAGVAEVRSVYVRDGWTRKGLAGQLVDRVEDEAQASGFVRLRLDAMLGSQPFYAARGYGAVAEMVFDIGGVPFPGVTMTKSLGRAAIPTG